MRLPISRRFHSLALLSSLICVGFLSSACSEQSAASQPADSPVKVENTQMFITVRNDSGMPLTDVVVQINPRGAAAAFDTAVGRLENSESKNIMLGDFRSRDGSPFSLRVIKPRTVTVKGTDVLGKAVTVEAPWK